MWAKPSPAMCWTSTTAAKKINTNGGLRVKSTLELLKFQIAREECKDDKEKMKGKASDDHRIKDSTDETESSEEILKTSSSVKSSSDDQKRKKGTSSPESEISAKREDKKFKFGTDSDSSLDKKKTDSDEASDMKGK